jgi:hemoglobin/transferrin/lactoferrin receptor protein
MQVRRNRSALLACTATAVLSLAAAAFAQSAPADTASGAAASETALSPIIVKGKRVGQTGTVADTPLATATNAEAIAKNEITSIADLGNTTEPGVDFLKSEGGVVIRGLGGPRVLTTIDGIPIPYLSNSARSGGPSTMTNGNGGADSFDFSSLSAVDILRGADSSRAGSGALAGALLLRTLEPEDLIAEGRDWGGVSKLIYDSEDNSFGGSAAIAKRFDNTSVLFQGGYKTGHETENKGSVDAIGAARTEANPADFDQYNLLFKLRQQLEGGHTVGITGERFSREITTDLKTLQGGLVGTSRRYAIGDHWGHDDSQRDRVSLDYRFASQNVDSIIDEARASIYWQRLVKNAGAEGTRLAAPAIGPWYRDNELEESSVGFTGSATSRFETGTLSHEVTIGGSIASFSAEQYLTGRDACVVNPAIPGCGSLHSNQADMPLVDGTRLGIYLDDRIAFGDSGFALTPGVRFDWHDYNPKLTPQYAANPGFPIGGLPAGNDGSRVTPKLLATYQATPSIELFAQWSMAYRAPTVDELYLDFANPASGYAVLGNANLKPETGQGFELGTNLGDDMFGGRVALFHNRYRNFIDTQTQFGHPSFPAFVQTNINRDKVEISGIEMKAHKYFDNGFNLHGALAYAYGKDKTTGEFIRSVAPFKAVVGFGYQQENWGTDLSLVASAGMRDDGVANTFDAPGYGVTNLTGWWEPEQFAGLRIQAGVYNLFDKTYFNAVKVKDINPNAVPSDMNSVQTKDFYSEAGRTFKISLTQRF